MMSLKNNTFCLLLVFVFGCKKNKEVECYTYAAIYATKMSANDNSHTIIKCKRFINDSISTEWIVSRLVPYEETTVSKYEKIFNSKNDTILYGFVSYRRSSKPNDTLIYTVANQRYKSCFIERDSFGELNGTSIGCTVKLLLVPLGISWVDTTIVEYLEDYRLYKSVYREEKKFYYQKMIYFDKNLE